MILSFSKDKDADKGTDKGTDTELNEDPVSAQAPLFNSSKSYKDSQLVIIPAPWEATASFGSGTSHSPKLIRQASHQMDFFHESYSYETYNQGIFFLPERPEIERLHCQALKLCSEIQSLLTQNKEVPPNSLLTANEYSDQFNSIIYEEAKKILKDKKIPALFGGDHSTPFGLMKALSESYDSWGLLHIDAHLDLRIAYQGFKHSHASIIYNVCQIPNKPQSVAHLGVRDFSLSEYKWAKDHAHGLWTDRKLWALELDPQPWLKTLEEILWPLAQNIYISFDIDGLNPDLCPETGTPVPGGLSYKQACQLIEYLALNKNIIGFDLVEVGGKSQKSDSWDLNVGARLLFELCLATLTSSL